MNVWKLKYINGFLNNLVWVIICFIMVTSRFPEKIEKHFNASFADNIKAIVLFFVCFAIIQFVFDWIGMIIYRKEKGNTIKLFTLIKRYLKGTYIHLSYYVLSALLILFLSTKVAWWFGIIAVLALMSLQVSFQLFWARSVGSFKLYPFDNSFLKENTEKYSLKLPEIIAIENVDNGFTGGYTGDKGNEKLIIPASWIKEFPMQIFQTQVLKRISVLHSSAKKRGIVFAYIANALMFLLSAYLSNFALNTLSGLLNTICFFTVFHFLALLLLNRISRRGVNEGDVFAFDHKVPFDDLESSHAYVESKSNLNCEETTSSFFHLVNPIPSTAERLRYLKEYDEHPWGAWNATRMSLYLSWSCLGLLSRSDFSIIGRPELWVLQPMD